MTLKTDATHWPTYAEAEQARAEFPVCARCGSRNLKIDWLPGGVYAIVCMASRLHRGIRREGVAG